MTIGGFEIDRKFSLGHLITIITVIVSVTIGWQSLAGQTAENSETNDKQDMALNSLLLNANSDRLETQKLLTEMRVDIRYLRRTVENEKREEEAE